MLRSAVRELFAAAAGYTNPAAAPALCRRGGEETAARLREVLQQLEQSQEEAQSQTPAAASAAAARHRHSSKVMKRLWQAVAAAAGAGRVRGHVSGYCCCCCCDCVFVTSAAEAASACGCWSSGSFVQRVPYVFSRSAPLLRLQRSKQALIIAATCAVAADCSAAAAARTVRTPSHMQEVSPAAAVAVSSLFPFSTSLWNSRPAAAATASPAAATASPAAATASPAAATASPAAATASPAAATPSTAAAAAGGGRKAGALSGQSSRRAAGAAAAAVSVALSARGAAMLTAAQRTSAAGTVRDRRISATQWTSQLFICRTSRCCFCCSPFFNASSDSSCVAFDHSVSPAVAAASSECSSVIPPRSVAKRLFHAADAAPTSKTSRSEAVAACLSSAAALSSPAAVSSSAAVSSPAAVSFPADTAAAPHLATSPAAAAAALPPLPFFAAGRTMPGQRLLPLTATEAAILCDSTVRYPTPQEVERGIVVRIIRRSDPVSSPVLRCIHNRQFGIRGSERWQLLAVGSAAALLLFGLGCWQLQRMQEKQQLIEYRRKQLRRKPVFICGRPFPWTRELLHSGSHDDEQQKGESTQQQQQHTKEKENIPQKTQQQQQQHLQQQQQQRQQQQQHLQQQQQYPQQQQHHAQQKHPQQEEDAQQAEDTCIGKMRMRAQRQQQQIIERKVDCGGTADSAEPDRFRFHKLAALTSLFSQQLLSYLSSAPPATAANIASDASAAGDAGVGAAAAACAAAAAFPEVSKSAASPAAVSPRAASGGPAAACYADAAGCRSSSSIAVASAAAESMAATAAARRLAAETSEAGAAAGFRVTAEEGVAAGGKKVVEPCCSCEHDVSSSRHSTTPDCDEAVLHEWSYRPVIARGVLDTSIEIKIGPRPGIENGATGCCIVSPLRLEDGEVLLVNKGHLLLPRARLPAFDKAQALQVQRRQRMQQQQQHNSRLSSNSSKQGSEAGSNRSREDVAQLPAEELTAAIAGADSTAAAAAEARTTAAESRTAAAGVRTAAAAADSRVAEARTEHAEKGEGRNSRQLILEETSPVEWRDVAAKEWFGDVHASSSSNRRLTTREEPPGWVTIRGVLEPGELLPHKTARGLFSWLHAGNRPKENQFLYIVPKDLVEALAPRGIIRNAAAVGMFVVNAYDILYDEDVFDALKKSKREQQLLQQRHMKLQEEQEKSPSLQQQLQHTEHQQQTRPAPQRHNQEEGDHQQQQQQPQQQQPQQQQQPHQQQQALHQQQTYQQQKSAVVCGVAEQQTVLPGLRICSGFGRGKAHIFLSSGFTALPAQETPIRSNENSAARSRFAAASHSDSTACDSSSTATSTGGTVREQPLFGAAAAALVHADSAVCPVPASSAASPRAAAAAPSSVPVARFAAVPAACGVLGVVSPVGRETPAAAAAAGAHLLLPRSIADVYEQPSSLSALLRIPGVRRRFLEYQQKRKDDYLLFWADEHTHFNYACQWFLMAFCCACMTLYKFIEVSRWKF